jgi:hypothetical protein
VEVSRPVRIRRTYTQVLAAPPEKVFPLLCPVRELEWVNGWNPLLVLSESGFVEPDCIFLMPDKPRNSVWMVTRWQPEEFFVEFVKFTPEFTVGKIEIWLRRGGQEQTLAEVSYCYTALSPAGAEFVQQFTAEHYEAFMKEWEAELNHFLLTGTRKNAPPH